MKKSVFLTLLLTIALLFADFVPHVPSHARLRTVEDFYRLYYLPSYRQNNDMLRNIYYLQIALSRPFAHPIQALVVTDTEKQYEKYQLLLHLHIYYLLARDHLYLAARYDKHEPVFFNKEFSEEILASLEYAQSYYELSEKYWKKVLEYIEHLEAYKGTYVELPFIMDIPERQRSGDLDLKRVIDRKLKKLETTRDFFQD